MSWTSSTQANIGTSTDELRIISMISTKDKGRTTEHHAEVSSPSY